MPDEFDKDNRNNDEPNIEGLPEADVPETSGLIEIAPEIDSDGKASEEKRQNRSARGVADMLLPLEYERCGFKGFWRTTLRERKYLGLCFVVPAVIMWLVYIAMQVYPFGENSVLVLDLNGQYVYFFEGLRNTLHGEGSFLYSFFRSLGGEFFGIYAYYLASPFSYIVSLFPSTMITEALLVMFLLKCGACGLTFGIYIEATRKRNRIPTVIFSSMYALCMFAVVMQHNTMWIDNMIFLPLICLGIERLIKYGRYKLFAFSLIWAVLSNFYIGYMMCIFVVIYFFYYYLSRTNEQRNPLGTPSHFPVCVCRIIIVSVIAVAICSIIILPTYYSLTFGKTEFTDPSYKFAQKFDFLNMLSKLYFGSYDTVRPDGLPFLYTGMLSLILLPVYFVAPRVKTREKIASAILIAIFVFSFNSSTIDMAWHGFQAPNWLNYRYAFMLCFFLVLFAYKAFEQLRDINYRYVMGSVGLVVLMLLIMQRFGFDNLPDLEAVWPSLLLAVLYLGLARGLTGNADANLIKTITIVLVIIVPLELFASSLVSVAALDDDVIYSNRTGYRTFIDRLTPVVDRIKETDDSFYRMEKTVHRRTNDNFALSMRGLSNSTSTLNSDTISFLNNMGLAAMSHWTKYLGSTPLTDSLLGIKYVIAEDTESFDYYEKLFIYNNDLAAYKNPYALSVAYGVNPDIASFDMYDNSTVASEMTSPFVRANGMVTAMLGGQGDGEIYKAAQQPTISYQNCSVGTTKDGHVAFSPQDKDYECSVCYNIQITSEDTLYCYFPSKYNYEAYLSVDGHGISTFFGNESRIITELGSFNIGDTIQVKLTYKEEAFYIYNDTDYFFYFDDIAFESAMEKLSECQFEIGDDYNEDTLRGKLTVTEGHETVFTSIPYDEGWVVTANGESVDIYEVCDALIAFNLEPGEYELELKYRPRALKYGIIICLTGCAALAAVIAFDEYRRRKGNKGEKKQKLEKI